MDLGINRPLEGLLQYSVFKPYHSNNDDGFPGRGQTIPAPIMIDDETEWEVETIS